jgi:hypothetical protein
MAALAFAKEKDEPSTYRAEELRHEP